MIQSGEIIPGGLSRIQDRPPQFDSKAFAQDGEGFVALLQQFLIPSGTGGPVFDSMDGSDQRFPTIKKFSSSSLSLVANRKGNLSLIPSKSRLAKVSQDIPKSNMYGISQKLPAKNENPPGNGEPSADVVKTLEKLKELTQEIEKYLKANESAGPQEILEYLKNDPDWSAVFGAMDDEMGISLIKGLEKGISLETELIKEPAETSSNKNEVMEGLLLALRNDPREGALWKFVDDETATTLLNALDLEGQAPEDPSQDISKAPNGQAESEMKTFPEIETVETENVSIRNIEEGLGENTVPAGEDPAGETVLPIQTRLVAVQGYQPVQEMVGDEETGNLNWLTRGNQSNPEAVNIIARSDSKGTSKDGHFGSGDQGLKGNFSGNPSQIVKAEAREAGSQDQVRQTVFTQLIDKIFLMNSPRQLKTLTIHLKPEFLGKVHMELTSKDGGVAVRIRTDNALVKDQIEELAPRIKAHLAEQGIHLGQLTVDISSKDPDGQKDESFSGNRNMWGWKSSNIKSINSKPEKEYQTDVVGPIVHHSNYSQGIDLKI